MAALCSHCRSQTAMRVGGPSSFALWLMEDGSEVCGGFLFFDFVDLKPIYYAIIKMIPD